MTLSEKKNHKRQIYLAGTNLLKVNNKNIVIVKFEHVIAGWVLRGILVKTFPKFLKKSGTIF